MPLSRPAVLAVGFVALAAAAASTAAQTGGGTDRVYFHDRKTDGSVVSKTGDLKESPAGVQVFSGGKVIATVPAADIVRVEYTTLPGLDTGDKQTMLTFDGKSTNYSLKDATDARVAFAAMAKKVGTADEKTRRAVDYREAVWSARAADFQTGDEFAKQALAAADKLKAVAQAAGKSWEPYPCARLAARLYAGAGKPAAAAGVLSAVSKLKDLPPEVRAEAKAAELAATYRGSGKLAAESLAAEYARDRDFPADGPTRDLLTVYQAVVKAPKDGRPTELIAAVETAIGRTPDGATRAALRNALGDFYLANGRPRDAMWEFLWVETVFNTDRGETIHAVGRLADVFEKLGDKDRAEAYRKKLPEVRTGA